MVWITRSVEQIAYQLPMLLNCTYAFVYYTGKDKLNPKVVSSFHHFKHCVLYQGRPDMINLINWLVHSQHQQLAHEVPPGPTQRGTLAAAAAVVAMCCCSNGC